LIEHPGPAWLAALWFAKRRQASGDCVNLVQVALIGIVSLAAIVFVALWIRSAGARARWLALLGMNSIAAFPIMMVSGALLQSVASGGVLGLGRQGLTALSAAGSAADAPAFVPQS